MEGRNLAALAFKRTIVVHLVWLHSFFSLRWKSHDIGDVFNIGFHFFDKNVEHVLNDC